MSTSKDGCGVGEEELVLTRHSYSRTVNGRDRRERSVEERLLTPKERFMYYYRTNETRPQTPRTRLRRKDLSSPWLVGRPEPLDLSYQSTGLYPTNVGSSRKGGEG